MGPRGSVRRTGKVRGRARPQWPVCPSKGAGAKGLGALRDTAVFAVSRKKRKKKGVESDGGQRPQEACSGQYRGKALDMAL